MFVNVLVYGGFTSKNITKDSIIRLVLVGVYAVANIGHQYHTINILYRNFSFVLFQTCWTIICRDFIFLDSRHYAHFLTTEDDDENLHYRDQLISNASDMVWTRFNLELFGTTERLDTYRVLYKDSDQIGSSNIDGSFKLWSKDDKRRESHLKARGKTESKLDKFVKPLREAEIKAYEKATDSALENVLANVAVLFGICLATALAPWTSTYTNNATSAQLGSYALLLSISTGILALVSSITLLTNATESARTLLLFQEKTIAAGPIDHEREDVAQRFSLWDKPELNFSKGIAYETQLTPFSLWRSTSPLAKLPCLLFGTALMLIPRFHGDRKSFRDEKMWLFLRIQDISFAYFASGSHIRPRLFRSKPCRSLTNEESGQELENLHA